MERHSLPTDHPVFVKSPLSRQWFRRHFAGWDKQGNMMVWNNGSTSHSYCSNNMLRDNIDNESIRGEFVSSFSCWYWED